MRSGWLLALLASLMAVSCWSAFAEGSALNRAQILSAIPDFEEKDRIKDEVAKEVSKYLVHVLS